MNDNSSRTRAPKVVRERLDLLVVERGLAPSRERARALIMAGEIRVAGKVMDKAGTMVPSAAEITLADNAAEVRYASRGGLKLEHALDVFHIDPAGGICLDVGASTGGFTDVLLRRGATRVYAIDVGRGQLAWSLQQDPRVVVMDRTNIRGVAALPETVTGAVIDVSFISLRLVLPHVARLIQPGAWIVALVKPQFEAGRAEVSRGGGVISDPSVHRRVLRELIEFVTATSMGDGPALAAIRITASPITGRDGNHEYLVHLTRSDPAGQAGDSLRAGTGEIEMALKQAFAPDTEEIRP